MRKTADPGARPGARSSGGVLAIAAGVAALALVVPGLIAAGMTALFAEHDDQAGPTTSTPSPLDADVPEPDPCTSGMARLVDRAANVDDDPAAPYLSPTLGACATAAEWVEAIRAFPGAAGRTDISADDAADLLADACVTAPAWEPVCDDARSRDLIP